MSLRFTETRQTITPGTFIPKTTLAFFLPHIDAKCGFYSGSVAATQAAPPLCSVSMRLLENPAAFVLVARAIPGPIDGGDEKVEHLLGETGDWSNVEQLAAPPRWFTAGDRSLEADHIGSPMLAQAASAMRWSSKTYTLLPLIDK